MLQLSADLTERTSAGAAQELTLRAPALASQLVAGRAVLVRAGWGGMPYLRRTFYPIAIDAATWTLRVPPDADWGHAWLRTAPIGSQLDCLGPVGNGYSLPAGIRNLLCVGEGEAAWSLLPAIWQAEAQGIAVTLAAGALSSRGAIPATRLPASVEYRLAAADGSRSSYGKPGHWLPELLPWADAVLAAGPLSLYADLAGAMQTARFGLSRGLAQVLYPATFLCGTGACHACAAEVAGGRRRVCQRGPVFDLVDLQP